MLFLAHYYTSQRIENAHNFHKSESGISFQVTWSKVLPNI
jgi:hypothetical protein